LVRVAIRELEVVFEQHLDDLVHHDVAVDVVAFSQRLQMRGQLAIDIDDVAAPVA